MFSVSPVLGALLDYSPIVNLEIGPLRISPHGIGIAVGFLLGASFFLRWCREAGYAEDVIYSFINRAAVGSIIGARVAYVINHSGDFDNPLEIFAVWEGGISLLGGIAGSIVAGIPKMRSAGYSFWKVMDTAVPCVAMGIVVGRIGDLVIADHLGKPTDFFLGYVCPAGAGFGEGVGDVVGSPCLNEVGAAVHQPAFYDLISASILLFLLFRLRRTRRYDGFLTLFFGAWYGAGRFGEDFFRIDETHGLGLTGSQWTALTVLSLCLFGLLVKKDTPWKSGRGEFASYPVGTAPAGEAPGGAGVSPDKGGDDPADTTAEDDIAEAAPDMETASGEGGDRPDSTVG